MSLKTDYKNYVPTEDMGGLRRYTKIDNPDGTVSFQDVTTYEVEGSKYGADDANATNKAINTIMGSGVEVTYEEGTVKITAPEGMTMVTFIAPSNYSASDKYTINDDEITLSDLNGEPLDDAWKQGSPVTFVINGNKAFFKAGGGGKIPPDLAPLCPNFRVERNGGKVKITADKILLTAYTNMIAGGVWGWGKAIPTKPLGENTKMWSREELITTGKPYDGLYLGDVTPSDAVSEVLLWLPENKDGKVVLIPFIILSVDYLGGVYVVRKFVWAASAFGVYGVDSYDGSTLDTFIMQSYANSVISDEILNEIVEVDYSIYSVSLSANKTVKRKVITVSAGECNMGGFSDGNKIQRFSTPANRIAYDESGQARAYWTRTKNNDSVSIGVTTSGNFTGYTSTSSQYTRPSFVLPKDFKVQKRPDGSYTAWTGESGLTWSDLMVSDEVTETIVNILEPKTGMVPTIYLSDDFNESDALLLLRRDVLNVTAIGNRYTSGGAVDQYSKSNTYAKIQSWAENDVDPKIIAKKVLTTIKQRSVYYDGQDKNVYAITSCEAYAFELGNDELGFSAFSEGVCGTKLPYFSSDTRRIGKLDANIESYNTRDAAVRPLASADSWYIVTVGGTSCSTTRAVNVRPSILISKDVWFNKLADGSYDLIPEDPAPGTQTVSTLAETGTYTFIGDSPTPTEQPLEIEVEWPESEPFYARQWVYNGKGYYQTMLESGVAVDVPVSGLRLGDMPLETLISVNEGGSPALFIVAKHDYEPELNGKGRVLFVRKNSPEDRRWNSKNISTYANSEIDAYLNGDYKNNLDAEIKTAIGTTKFKYSPGNRDDTVGDLERSVFLLSLTEVGENETTANAEGSKIPISVSSVLQYGTTGGIWTRSPQTGESGYVWRISRSVGNSRSPALSRWDYWPCFTLSADTLLDPKPNPDGSYNIIY